MESPLFAIQLSERVFLDGFVATVHRITEPSKRRRYSAPDIPAPLTAPVNSAVSPFGVVWFRKFTGQRQRWPHRRPGPLALYKHVIAYSARVRMGGWNVKHSTVVRHH